MKKYDGPSYYRKDELVMKKELKKETKQRTKYRLPQSVRTRQDIQDEATQYMETPNFQTKRFKQTQLPPPLSKLNAEQTKGKNEEWLTQMRSRLEKKPEDYLLFVSPTEKRKTKKVKQAERVQETMQAELQKPNSGLHRSLSKIIADEQQVMKKKQKKLNHLFHE